MLMSYIEQTQQGTLWCDKKYLKMLQKKSRNELLPLYELRFHFNY